MENNQSSYSTYIHSSFKKDAKAIQKIISKNDFEFELQKIIAKPESGEFLKHPSNQFQKISFHRKPEVRIIYRFTNCFQARQEQKEISCLLTEFEHDEPTENNCLGLIEFFNIKKREDMNLAYKNALWRERCLK